MEHFDILYRDETLVAVNKPSGLLVHRSDIDRHETHFALQMLRDQMGQRVYPVHRLDKPTSGVLLFALNSEAARATSTAFAAGAVEKTYLAVVRGYPDPQTTIDYPLRDTWDKMSAPNSRRAGNPRPASTALRCLATAELSVRVDRYPTSRYALVEARPFTGRRHQIRRHMKHIAHPIIGDTTYGKSRHNRLFAQRFDCARLLLHAAHLSFPHPISAQIVSIPAPLDGPFSRVIEGLGWRNCVDIPR